MQSLLSKRRLRSAGVSLPSFPNLSERKFFFGVEEDLEDEGLEGEEADFW